MENQVAPTSNTLIVLQVGEDAGKDDVDAEEREVQLGRSHLSRRAERQPASTKEMVNTKSNVASRLNCSHL